MENVDSEVPLHETGKRRTGIAAGMLTVAALELMAVQGCDLGFGRYRHFMVDLDDLHRRTGFYDMVPKEILQPDELGNYTSCMYVGDNGAIFSIEMHPKTIDGIDVKLIIDDSVPVGEDADWYPPARECPPHDLVYDQARLEISVLQDFKSGGGYWLPSMIATWDDSGLNLELPHLDQLPPSLDRYIAKLSYEGTEWIPQHVMDEAFMNVEQLKKRPWKFVKEISPADKNAFEKRNCPRYLQHGR
ncbi:MAG: hypothetical protein KJ709_02625 [Nanoarchaeota archaeon]|nr:hypothetical protein [Nanoarchaeota archaeon]